MSPAPPAPTQNSCLLRALRRQPTSHTPVWLMRQAGRYLPEYRALRERAGSILELFRNPELACEAALQPLARYPLDAAILFSDILTIPDAMGLGLYFVDGEGPRFARPLHDPEDFRALRVPDPEEQLAYVLEAVRLTRRALDESTPLIGFCGSPWTLATYMVEGGKSDFRRVLQLVREEPLRMHALLELLARAAGRCLDAQRRAGAQALQIFDSWGGVLAAADYEEFSLRWIRRTLEELRVEENAVPVIVFVRDRGRSLEELAQCGCAAVGIDEHVDIAAARRRVDGRVAVQGNLPPALLCGPPDAAAAGTRQILDTWGGAPGHVFNLGHGVSPDARPETVAAVVQAVREWRRD